MTTSGVARSAAALAVGAAITISFYLALLYVPEANVLSLGLSGVLVLLIVLAAGLTTGLVASLPGHGWRAALRRAPAALPAFAAGLFLFGALFVLLGRVEALWMQHRGEIDAMLLPHIGTRSTASLHTFIAWLLWLGRWAVGLSLVLGLVVAAAGGRARRGLRLALAAAPLAAMTVAALVLSQVLWRIVYWRPGGLPATSLEIGFVVLKLTVLYAMAALTGAMVVGVYLRTARGLINPHPVRTEP